MGNHPKTAIIMTDRPSNPYQLNPFAMHHPQVYERIAVLASKAAFKANEIHYSQIQSINPEGRQVSQVLAEKLRIKKAAAQSFVCLHNTKSIRSAFQKKH